MQKNYQQEARRYIFDYSRGTDLKVQFNSNKKHPAYGVLTYPPPSPHLPQVTSTLKLGGYGWQ